MWGCVGVREGDRRGRGGRAAGAGAGWIIWGSVRFGDGRRYLEEIRESTQRPGQTCGPPPAQQSFYHPRVLFCYTNTERLRARSISNSAKKSLGPSKRSNLNAPHSTSVSLAYPRFYPKLSGALFEGKSGRCGWFRWKDVLDNRSVS